MYDMIREYLATHSPDPEEIEESGEHLANGKACVVKLRALVHECNQWISIVESFGIRAELRIEVEDAHLIGPAPSHPRPRLYLDASLPL